jgi:ankyrin repeat protein
MASDQSFGIKGPIAKLALERGVDMIRSVSGRKPKSVDLKAVQKLVSDGLYTWCLLRMPYVTIESGLQCWRVGASGDDFVEFFAPSRDELALIRESAQAQKNPAKPPVRMVKRLFKAIGENRIKEVGELAPIAARGTSEGRSPLHFAARRHNAGAIEALLPHCDPNALEEYSGETALMQAIEDAECACLLLAVSDLKVVSTTGRTALMVASQSSRMDEDVFDMILENSEPHLVDEAGMTALMHAGQNGLADHIKKLLPFSDARTKDRKGRDALAVVFSDDQRQRDRMKRERPRFEETIELLLDPCDLTWRGPNGKDIPSLCAELGMNAVLDTLSKSGRLGPSKAGRDTPLITATRVSMFDTVASLIPQSDLDAKGANGDTALIVAAKGRSSQLLRRLLRGSNPNAQNDKGLTALMATLMAMPEGSFEDEAILHAVRCALQLLPRTDLNLQDESGSTALMCAIKPRCPELFEIMLERADANIQDKAGRNALMRITGFQRDEHIFAELLIPRTDLSSKDAMGRTALMLHVDQPALVELLLPGSDVDARDTSGRTALMHAAQRASYYSTRQSILLLLPLADARLVDNDGKSAAMIAHEEGGAESEDIATLIEKAELAKEVPKVNRTAAEIKAARKKKRERDL